LNGSSKRSFNISLNFLDNNKKYKAQIFSDDASLKTRTKVKITTMEVDAETVFSPELLKMNGLAIILTPITKK
jgi:alpha-glucosidase